MRIIGLDVGCGSAVLCCLDEFPINIITHYKTKRRSREFITVKCDGAGVDKLLSLQPDAIVIEPTGHWYSHFWVTVAKQNDINICWISHTDLDKQRGSYGFTNKHDSTDALCLAATYFDPRFIDGSGKPRFLDYYYSNDVLITRVREIFLAKEQLQKLRSALISQLRQRLAFEYPEAVKHNFVISKSRGFTPMIGWLAHGHSSTRLENKYKLSVAHDLDIQISSYTRNHASTIVDIEQRITEHLDKLSEILNCPEFKPYFEVFDRFGFGLNNKMLLLYHCYPLDKFLVDGKAFVEREEGKNGKMQKRDRSLRKFQAFMGMSYKYRQSGDKSNRSFHGSSIVRAHLYVWAVCMVAPKNYRIKTDVGKQLSDRYDELRQTVKGKDALIRILFKATRMLFYELLNNVIP